MLRPLSLLFITLFSLDAIAQQDTCTTTLNSVSNKIGEVVVFCGTPASVKAPPKTTGDPVYLNFGGAFPQKAFTAVIWGDISGKQRKELVKRYSDRSLRITGLVTEFKGTPTITIADLKDIVVDEGDK